MWYTAGAIALTFITLWGIAEVSTYLVLRRIDDPEPDWDW